MTDARVTQIAEEVVNTAVAPNARVTQIAEEVVNTAVAPNARVTQFCLEVLNTTVPPTFPEAAFEPGGLTSYQTLYWARCWLITREDGVTFAFTDHDAPLTTDSYTFTPVNSPKASALQQQSGLRPNNFNIVAALDDDAITHNDLLLGKYRNAQVEEWILDWRVPWAWPLRYTKSWIGTTTFNGDFWEAECINLAEKLKKPVGFVYSRKCRHTLGDEHCTVNLAALTIVSKTVSSVIDDYTKFDPTGTPDASGYWSWGTIAWVTGNNAGVISEIKNWDGTNITLSLRTALPIQPGDIFDITPGCDKDYLTCNDKFDNKLFFGGFPTIPGPDKVLENPKLVNNPFGFISRD